MLVPTSVIPYQTDCSVIAQHYVIMMICVEALSTYIFSCLSVVMLNQNHGLFLIST